MDLLGEVLLSLKVKANSGGIYSLGSEWGFDVPAMPAAFAYALCCIDTPYWVMLDGQAPLQLQPGDSALLLHGAAFRMGSSPTSECVDLHEYWLHHNLPVLTPSSRQGAPISGLALGEAPRNSRMLTLAFVLHDGDGNNPLLRSLPPMILLRDSASGLFPWISTLVTFLANETTAAKAGYLATATHVAQLILTSFIRAHALFVPTDSTGWLRGMADKRIRQALASIHTRPGDPWTTESLATEAGMSRFTFGRRFTKLIGQSPIEYLIDWRMQIAAEKLLEGQHSIARIAEEVGYQSERAFREVFKKRFGHPPLRYAKRHQVTELET
ncbi:AraC family transcriptional regulator [Metapseudomonas resinovorans]|uniref:AraC family transcriptional regulator n=1 Tax=Metapseudomonas resinovorans TaxID=53412 RepID=UPI00048C7BB8|nr:AraC family transcriptional regulator [Pseudomonas resinovorans]